MDWKLLIALKHREGFARPIKLEKSIIGKFYTFLPVSIAANIFLLIVGHILRKEGHNPLNKVINRTIHLFRFLLTMCSMEI
jgi:hypothetical protein